MTIRDIGAINEFKGLDFKDSRLNNRFEEIIKKLDTRPSGVITEAFVDAKDQKAAYRFFGNKKVGFSRMLTSHQEQVFERCKNEEVILAIQDSTALHLTGARKADNIGMIGDLKHPGLNVHTTFLLSASGPPLGIGDLQIYDRKFVTHGTEQDKLSAYEKESGRWLQAISRTRSTIKKSAKLVWIADREGDFWDYFHELTSRNELFVQRIVHERRIKESDVGCVEYVKQSPVIGTHVFEVAGKGGKNERKKRTAVCEVRMTTMTLKKPKNKPRDFKELRVQIIHVQEIENTTSKEPVEWVLVTNIKCENFENILEKIKWYCLRWTIEELHRIVKSGCGVEDMRLEAKDRLMKLLLLLFIIAARILWMLKLTRKQEEVPCTEAFSDEEWKVLYLQKNKRKPPPEYIPNIREVVRWTATLGGFYEYNKKRDPGAMTLWRGLKRLREIIESMELLQEIHSNNVGAK